MIAKKEKLWKKTHKDSERIHKILKKKEKLKEVYE